METNTVGEAGIIVVRRYLGVDSSTHSQVKYLLPLSPISSEAGSGESECGG
jgi:hypothetical protein